MTIIDPVAVQALKDKLKRTAMQRRLAPKPAIRVEKKPASTAQLLTELVNGMKALLAEIQSQRPTKSQPTGVKFEITERDLDGRIKAFKVDQS